MKRKILETIAAMPGCRQRSIASAIGIWQCDADFLECLRDLRDAGLIYRISHSDPAQMEFFYKWYLTNAGERAIMNVENKEGDFIYG
jgi:hypothetical protein